MAVNTVRINATSREEGSRSEEQRVQGKILGKDSCRSKGGWEEMVGQARRGAENCHAVGRRQEGLSTNYNKPTK